MSVLRAAMCCQKLNICSISDRFWRGNDGVLCSFGFGIQFAFSWMKGSNTKKPESNYERK